MNTSLSLAAYVGNVLQEVVKGPIINNKGEISVEKLQKPRIRVQSLVETPPRITIEHKEGKMIPLMNLEIMHCAAVIVAAFLNPIPIGWDYDRYAESSDAKRSSEKYFARVHLGLIKKPTTLVDKHGRIIMWYLPHLLLPHRVEELNRVTKCLKVPLCQSTGHTQGSLSWRSNGFTCDGGEATFGAGKLSLSVGKFQLGHTRLQDPICSSPELRKQAVCQWLQFIEPVEQLLDAVLQIVHPDMSLANGKATPLLLQQLNTPLPTWPTIYPGMDVISNRITPAHRDQGGANPFYDHLVSFGEDHDACFWLNDLHGEFMYKPGTSVLFSGKVLAHSVPEWSGGERLVIAHYANDVVHDRLMVARPTLPTQLGWWSKYR